MQLSFGSMGVTRRKTGSVNRRNGHTCFSFVVRKSWKAWWFQLAATPAKHSTRMARLLEDTMACLKEAAGKVGIFHFLQLCKLVWNWGCERLFEIKSVCKRGGWLMKSTQSLFHGRLLFNTAVKIRSKEITWSDQGALVYLSSGTSCPIACNRPPSHGPWLCGGLDAFYKLIRALLPKAWSFWLGINTHTLCTHKCMQKRATKKTKLNSSPSHAAFIIEKHTSQVVKCCERKWLVQL